MYRVRLGSTLNCVAPLHHKNPCPCFGGAAVLAPGSEMMRRQKHLFLVFAICVMFIAPHGPQAVVAQPLLSTPITAAPIYGVGPSIPTLGTPRYLYPHNLHLAAGTTSAVPLTVIDHSGNAVSGTLGHFVTRTAFRLRPNPLFSHSHAPKIKISRISINSTINLLQSRAFCVIIYLEHTFVSGEQTGSNR